MCLHDIHYMFKVHSRTKLFGNLDIYIFPSRIELFSTDSHM